MKKILLLTLFFSVQYVTNAQENKEGVYPSNWWVGMKNPNVQLMIYAKSVALAGNLKIQYPGVEVIKVHKAENPNYLFVDIKINPSAKPGIVKVSTGNKTFDFPLKQRRPGNGKQFAQGVSSEDFVYLVMPDRFSNGDYSNDRIKGMKDQSLNRDSIFLRHGGDIQGIINHLDYLKDLGVTTLWLMPVLENDMPDRTEHGYAITDHYKVDPRLGGNEMYKKLSDAIHAKGMKLIQDAVYNHCGLFHFAVQDMPMKDWLHQWPEYTNTTYKDEPLMDTHAAPSDQKQMLNGWFTPMMPDLNQNNPYVADFLIQNAIWSVEEFGVDGWRIDTYIYNDLEFMNRCNKALYDEYPHITMFGEAWVHGVVNQAYFTRNKLNLPFKSNLTGTADFQTNLYGINPALTQKFGWTDGVNKLYHTLANDFLYEDPMTNVVFLDNHDMTRFFSQVGENLDKMKMGVEWLLTTRGIPQLYYGTEILMKGISNPDGWVRLDFKGGWKEDVQNKFTEAGRSKEENEFHSLVKTLANYRLHSSAIKTGKLMQYVPTDGLYVYARYDEKQTVLCLMNTDEKEKVIKFNKYAERTAGFKSGVNIISGETIQLNDALSIGSQKMILLELHK